MMSTVPLTNKVDLHIDWYRFTKHTHGPKVWPWWRLVVVHPVRWSLLSPIDRANARSHKGYNIWVYTRWGAWCHGVSWPKVAA